MNLKNLSVLFLMAALFICCERNEGFSDKPYQDKYPINISGQITQVYTTRVDDGGFCDGDQIGLYGVNWLNNNTTAGTLQDQGNQVDNARYTYDEANLTWNASGSIYYKDANTNIDLYAYYPYDTPSSVTAYPFEVHQNQAGTNTVDGYALSDFLWAKAENVTPSSNKVWMKFSHKLSCANVVLVEGTGFDEGEFATLKKSVLVMNTSRTANINLQTGEATVTGSPESEGIVMMNSADGFRAIVVPQTVAANTALFSITIDGIPYRFKTNSECKYQAGMLSSFTIEINKKSHSGELELKLINSEIKEWIADSESHNGEIRQYYVVNLEKPGTLGRTIKAAKKNPNKIKNLKVAGKINTGDFLFMRDSMELLAAVNLKDAEIKNSLLVTYYMNDGSIFKSYESIEQKERYNEDNLNFNYADIFQTRYENVRTVDFNEHNWDYDYEIPVNAYYGKKTLHTFSFPEKVTRIHTHAFYKTILSGALIIPEDVTFIGSYAFNETEVSSLELPYNLEGIEYFAFGNCQYLSGSLKLPDNLEQIGDYAFYNCNMLTGHLNIPSKIKQLPASCFTGCKFNSISLPEGLISIRESCLSGNNIRTLKLPKSLKEIHPKAFYNCKTQGELVIPKNVTLLGEGAFKNCSFSSILFEDGIDLRTIGSQCFFDDTRLSAHLEIPQSVQSIGSNAFDNCTSLPSVTIPKSVTTIASYAFANCTSLTKLKCDATTPPTLGSGVFNNIPKDNFTLEVPEASVPKYQTTTGWSVFKRIGAHYDFNISNTLLRALNTEYTKTYLLRVPSGEQWSIASKPDWVTIEAETNVGRSDVTITVAALDQGAGNRTGEIVFQLDNKDFSSGVKYTTTMKVEQFDCEYNDGQVITNQVASKGNGVNIVFMGDCFDAKDIDEGKYLAGINEAIGYFFAIEPYKSYKEYFNIYTIVGMSPESGMGTVNTIKEAKFGSQYSLEGITPDTETIYDYALNAETVTEDNLNQTLIVMVENTQDYGGICYMWGDGSAIAICPMSADAYPFDFRGIVQHEAGGHGFAKLADEYIYTNAFIGACGCNNPHLDSFYAGKAYGWYRNLSTNSNYKTVEWAHLFANPDYANVVDMYEGGYFHTRGIYRSEGNSCMNNNVPYYSAISRQEMVERIKKYAGEEFRLQDFYDNDVRDASNNDFVTTKSVSENVVGWGSAAKQMPPKYMGHSPKIRKQH